MNATTAAAVPVAGRFRWLGGVGMDDDMSSTVRRCGTKPAYRDAGFAARVREARENRGWSQQRLADELGISLTTVCRIETASLVPQDRIRIRLRDVLGVESAMTAGLIDGTTRYEDDFVCRVAVHTIAPCTLAVVGELMGISRERVRQIESSAVRKLKRHLGERGWFAALKLFTAREGETLTRGLSVWTGER